MCVYSQVCMSVSVQCVAVHCSTRDMCVGDTYAGGWWFSCFCVCRWCQPSEQAVVLKCPVIPLPLADVLWLWFPVDFSWLFEKLVFSTEPSGAFGNAVSGAPRAAPEGQERLGSGTLLGLAGPLSVTRALGSSPATRSLEGPWLCIREP